MFVGGITTCILDNLLPGTNEERGIDKWHSIVESENSSGNHRVSSIHVYDPPFLSEKFMQSKICKILPFLPYYKKSEVECAVNEGYNDQSV